MSSDTLPITPDTPWLAPMAGYTDLALRLLCREYGATVTCTEMVSAKGLVYRSPGTEPLLATSPEDAPLVLQLHGAEPEVVSQAMDILLDRGFKWFDLNAGCPAPKVARAGCGAAMLKETDNLIKVARAMIARAGRGRVGVKLRLGWSRDQTVYLQVAEALEQEGVGWLTLHPRFGRDGFGGSADWSALAELKRAVSVPVIASGDLRTAEDGLRCIRETGVDGIMFARGALRDPAVFTSYMTLVQNRGGEEPSARPTGHLARLARRHVVLARRYGGVMALLKLRSLLPRYIKLLPEARALRQELVLCTSWDELNALLDKRLPLEEDA
jgi:tRNA-dihydrouridine synthase B